LHFGVLFGFELSWNAFIYGYIYLVNCFYCLIKMGKDKNILWWVVLIVLLLVILGHFKEIKGNERRNQNLVPVEVAYVDFSDIPLAPSRGSPAVSGGGDLLDVCI
jgi:uncharacterized membrane protein